MCLDVCNQHYQLINKQQYLYDCTHNTAGLVDKFQANLIVIYFFKILTFPVPCLGVAYML